MVSVLLEQTEMQNTSMCFALRASVPLSKTVPDNFVVRRVEALFAFAGQIEQQVQTAIGNVLSDMNTELDVLQQRLSKTQNIKQGMMQELLIGNTRLV